VLAEAGAAPEQVAALLLAAPLASQEWMWPWLAGAVAMLGHRAPGVAAQLLHRALGQIPVTDPLREVLETALVHVAFLLAQEKEVERVARPLLARTSNPDRAAQVAWPLAYSLARSGRGAESAAVIEHALARPGVSAMWMARLGARRAVRLWENGQVDEAEQAAQRVLADAEQAGDRFAAGYALHVLSLVAFRRLDQCALLGHVERALAVIGDDPQTAELRVLLLSNLASILGYLDRHTEADRSIREAETLAEQFGNPNLGLIRTKAAEYYFDLGQWDDALIMLEAAAGLPGPDHLRFRIHAIAALIAGHRDDPAMEEHIAAVRGEALASSRHRAKALYLLPARALSAEQAGRTGEAVAVLAQILDPGFAALMGELFMLFPILARVALGAGDTATAVAAARAAEEEADRGPLPVRTAAARWCRGLVDGDPGPVLEAAAYYEAAGRRFDHAKTLEDAAVLLAGRGGLAEAQRAYTGAVRLYRDLGAAWDLRRADARLRRYDIRPGSGPRPRAAAGWAALTPTEAKIASLVADGLSNPDIAAELFLSRNTVQTHVSHVLAKLGARTRAEIIRQALEHAGA
jgi:DNA-binding CsgD family transcriptional regulator